jgi:hypothetical protein
VTLPAWLVRICAPTDAELAALIASLALPGQRRAARLYARGFVRGCDYCGQLGRDQFAPDLAAIEERLTTVLRFVRALRQPPESQGRGAEPDPPAPTIAP